MPTFIITVARAGAVTMLAALATIAAFVAHPLDANATTPSPPAWTVETVDGEHGSGRANFQYDVDPGNTLSDRMLVTNTGDSDLPLTMYAADAFTTDTGAVDILQLGEASVDAGTWIRVETASVTLAPGASTEVAFTITVPDNATPGDHSAALVASLLPGEGSGQVDVERRLGLRIDLRVSGEIGPAAEIRSLTTDISSSWLPFGSGTMHLTYELVNTGNVRLSSLEDLQFSGFAGTAPVVLMGMEVPELLPGSSVLVTREVAMSAVGPIDGSLTVYLQPVGAFAEVPVAVTAPLSAFVMPWGALIVFLVILAVIAVGVFLWWRRRRLDLLLATYDLDDETDARAEPARPSPGRLAGGAAAIALAAALLLAAPWVPTAALADTAQADQSIGIGVTIPTSTATPTESSPSTPSGAAVGPGAGANGNGPGSGAGGGDLARTGHDGFGSIALVGAALLLVGTASIAIAARRRRA